jgi:EAL domain-containing protein (putative c-di-GMP-specific phosphodiesterase class I)
MTTDDMNAGNKRYIAFAFAAAESFLEINYAGSVTFKSGIPFSEKLIPADKAKLVGHNLTEIIHPDDHVLFKISLKQVIDEGRMGPVNIRIGGKDDYWRRIRLFGIKLPEFKDKLYISVRAAGVSLSLPNDPHTRDDATGLLLKDAFTNVAAAAMRSSTDAQVTIAHFDGLAQHKETASKDAHNSLLKTISTHMQALSLEGQAAAQVGDGDFAILHDKKNNQEKMMQKIQAVPGAEKFKPKVQTISGDAVNLSEKEVIRAVSYTLEKFSESQGEVSISSFGNAYQLAFAETQDMIKKLKYAINRKTFNMAFQPIVKFSDHELHHYELLARPPENFGKKNIFEIVQFVEEINMNIQFDFSMCVLAAEYIHKNIKMNNYISLAVNFSGASIQDPSFVKEILAKLKGFQGMDRWLAIEITESSKILNLDAAAKSIAELRGKGYIVCLDDFGAGASGYQYLRELEVDFVKIDGIYIRDLETDKTSEAFVKSMVQLCNDLDIRTIAEYVENEAQERMLKNIGVDYAQGYLFGAAEPKPSYEKQ